jgi:hypothetical protein
VLELWSDGTGWGSEATDSYPLSAAAEGTGSSLVISASHFSTLDRSRVTWTKTVHGGKMLWLRVAYFCGDCLTANGGRLTGSEGRFENGYQAYRVVMRLSVRRDRAACLNVLVKRPCQSNFIRLRGA